VSRILLVDDAAALADMFGAAIHDQLGHQVQTVSSLAAVAEALAADGHIDLALVDLSFPNEAGSGLDALAEINRCSPGTLLAIITQGDEWVAQVLRDAWELLPIATVVSKSAPLAYQLKAISQVLSAGSAPPDPAIQPLLPRERNRYRTPKVFGALVPHAGHAKLWLALLESDDVSYKGLAQKSGLKMNTLKNYRAQLVPELDIHGVHDASLIEMRRFALRCSPFLLPFVKRALDRS
jgi:DNA-binding NarL/FixJ family response regulator